MHRPSTYRCYSSFSAAPDVKGRSLDVQAFATCGLGVAADIRRPT